MSVGDEAEPAADAGPDETYTASVVGGTGFTGGELLRILAGHPGFDVVQATSRSADNMTVGRSHPNLREIGRAHV